MSGYVRWMSALAVVVGLVTVCGTAQGSSLGAGIHYLRTLGDITADDTIDLNQDSFSLLASLKSDMGPLTLDGQVEYIFDYLGTDEAMWVPSAWALLGKTIYGGAGIGIGHTDGEWQTNPFYALRAGVEIPLGGMALDTYASYQFQSGAELEDLTGEDLDSLTFAALLRFGL
ncbi:MAG TPA: hypothetical protein VFP58_10990 [Candidatus Eisenbacteria bacterium]|nr:hypothetical protein [Candidatus Eisenbacteria bacterium]